MTDRAKTARVFLAVQEALRANQPNRRSLADAGSIEILQKLKDRSRPIAEVQKSVTSQSEWTTIQTIGALESSGLVSVRDDTVAITETGLAALGEARQS